MKIKNPDAFIRRVREYPYLYDPNHRDFRKNYIKNLAWGELAEEFNMPGIAETRQKWRSLRNTYLRCKRSQMNPSGPDKEYCTWPWRHAISFIDKYLNFDPPQSLQRQLKPINVEDMWCTGNDMDMDPDLNPDPLNSSSDEKNDKKEIVSPPKTKRLKYEEEEVEVEEEEYVVEAEDEITSCESVSEMCKENSNCSENWQYDHEQLEEELQEDQQQQEQDEEEPKLNFHQQQEQRMKLQQQRLRQREQHIKQQDEQLKQQEQQLIKQQQQLRQQQQQIKEQEQQLRKQQQQITEYQNQKGSQPDGINRLFQSYEETFRKFRPKTQALIKIKLSNLFAQTELNELCDQ